MFESETSTKVSRRRFIQIAAGSVLGVAFGASTMHSATAAAPSAGPSVAESTAKSAAKQYTYKGQTYAIVMVDGKERLQLNGKLQPEPHFARTRAGYASHMLPFENTVSGNELARKLIDGDQKLYYLAAPEGTSHIH